MAGLLSKMNKRVQRKAKREMKKSAYEAMWGKPAPKKYNSGYYGW